MIGAWNAWCLFWGILDAIVIAGLLVVAAWSAVPKGPNNTEALFNRDILAGQGVYEAVTLRLHGGSRYTPDWMLVDNESGRVHLFEVKGSYRLPSEGRALTAWREARAAFPMFRFHWAVRTNAGWEFRHGESNPAVRGREPASVPCTGVVRCENQKP